MINQLVQERERFFIFYTEGKGYGIATIENGIVLREGIDKLFNVNKEMEKILYRINFIKGIYS